jgi:hypothetical protein
MKKSFFTLAIIAFCAVGSYAQGISGGLKAGANFSNQVYSGNGFSASADARTGFHVGGYLNVGFSETFSLQPELLYNSVGAKIADTQFKTDYVSIPVMIKYNPAAIFNIHAGPQFGFLMSAKADDEDVKDGMKGLDLGIGVGAGVDLPMGLGITARYVMGLSNISEEANDTSGDVTVKNTAFQVSLSYRLFGE